VTTSRDSKTSGHPELRFSLTSIASLAGWNLAQPIVGNNGHCDKRGHCRYPTEAEGKYIAYRFVRFDHGLFSEATKAFVV